MGNRAQRRAVMRNTAQRNKKLIADYTAQERALGLIQNGITQKDVDDAFHEGFNKGFKAAAMPIIKSCIAATGAMLHDEFGFGEQRCYKALRALNEKMVLAIERQDLVDETLKKTGIEVAFDDEMPVVKGVRA